ncbi:MAG TPA: hypothetical protein VIL86_01455 [Tepidisphaeraceae bacterium]|jgi:hypothetical protein
MQHGEVNGIALACADSSSKISENSGSCEGKSAVGLLAELVDAMDPKSISQELQTLSPTQLAPGDQVSLSPSTTALV